MEGSILEQELQEFLAQGQDTGKRDKSALRITMTLNGLARQLGLKGTVHTFGSFSNGFKTGTSDLDVVLVSEDPKSAVSILQQFAENIPTLDLSFTNITKIFQASVPILKLTDRDSEMEVDFCVNNELGVRNSLLLNTYCKYDDRVLQLGRLVKEWAKKHELVGSTDGYLNSYAYMLLVVFFLQSVQPPVVPNLQMLETESFLVPDRKWGNEDFWETKFKMNVDDLPKSQNTMSIGELLVSFFQFYSRDFNWRQHAVCMRKFEAGKPVDKSSLLLPTNEEQWYVEDPFDLKHNLSGKCTRAGKKRLLEEMKTSVQLILHTGRFSSCLPSVPGNEFYMKCRVTQIVQPPDLLEAFEEFDLVKLHFPKPDGSMRMAQAFLQFGDAASRRRAHTKNEKYICDCQLQLHYSSQYALAEAITQSQFSTYEMASYKMQRQVLKARMQGQNQEMNFNLMKEMQPDIASMGFKPTMPTQNQGMWEEKMLPMGKQLQKQMVQMEQMQMQAMPMQMWTGQPRAGMAFPQPPPAPQNRPVVPPPIQAARKVENVPKEVPPGPVTKEKTKQKLVNASLTPPAKAPSVKPTGKATPGDGWINVKLTNNLAENFLNDKEKKMLDQLHKHFVVLRAMEKEKREKDKEKHKQEIFEVIPIEDLPTQTSLSVPVTCEPDGAAPNLSDDLWEQLKRVKDGYERIFFSV